MHYRRVLLAGLASVGGIVFFTGCVTQGVKAEKDKLTLIQPGVTTRSQIEQSFGPPDVVDTVESHSVMVYSHFKATGNILGFLGAEDYERQSYQFILNKNGTVDSYVLKEFKGASAAFDAAAKETVVSTTQPAK